jgi:PAS domain S-box-containing protein
MPTLTTLNPYSTCELPVNQHLAGIIFNSISDGVFTVDKKCIITSFNRAAEEITGFSAKTAVGKHCFDIFRTEVCHKQCALRDTLAKHKPVDKVRVTIITEDGCEVPIQVSTTLLRDDNGNIVGAVEFFNDLTEVEHLKRRVDKHSAINDIVSNSPIMRRIINTLPDIAESECNVLIQGPSGSGKELFAEAIHGASPRRYGPYVRLNCAALPANLLESEKAPSLTPSGTNPGISVSRAAAPCFSTRSPRWISRSR